ncbi:MAG: alpha/beta fold hydrolase [Pedosphaera sp.]|nr:alpha/beta fold hydrolase [Pedosphaera sp.]
MPLIEPSSYVPPAFLRSGHAQTVFPSVARTVRGVRYRRERIQTPDDDFLDLDWSVAESDRMIVIAHGLEGSSDRTYILGLVRACNRAGWDALAWNFRACSGEMNRQRRLYHSGETGDLNLILAHVRSLGRYRQLAVAGFSLGGNLTLKYLGELGAASPSDLVAGIVFSVPCDLATSSIRMAAPENAFYMRRFLRDLRGKIRGKQAQFDDVPDDTGFETIRTFMEFDERFTAPLHGFSSAMDYYTKSSSRQYLSKIRVPTLLINAMDDPFLSPECFPREEATANPWLHLEAPEHGGHCGFVQFNREGEYWSEHRAVEFLGGRS